MTSGDLLSVFRVEMNDQAEPFFWGDELVYSFINDAQIMFCRKTDGIADVLTSEVAPDVGYLDLHPSIKKIRDVTRLDTGARVRVINREDMAQLGWRFDGRPGNVRALVIGEQENKARTFPLASETVTLELLVFRLPLEAITDDQELEIGEEHHRHLLLWVKHLAYSVQDAETFDKTKAIQFEQAFLAYCRDAETEQRRKRYKPRTVAYGGL